jgi:hypothetical protein
MDVFLLRSLRSGWSRFFKLELSRFSSLAFYPPTCRIFVLTLSSPCFLCHHTHNYFFRNRRSPLVMILYHYLVARCFAVTFVCPIPGTTEGLLPRLAFGPVTKTAWMLYHFFGASIHSVEEPYVIRHSIRVSSYQKLVHFLLISRLDITVICALHKANPNALNSSEFGSEDV